MKEIKWNASYFDRRTWILENLENLHVESQEALVLLVIDYCNTQGLPISHELLAAKTKLPVDDIEAIFMTLTEKGYLTIEFEKGSIAFSIAGLFEEQPKEAVVSMSLIERFEMEFGRPLSSAEMQSILELPAVFPDYGEQGAIIALNEAIVYEKLNLNYIERVLRSWANKGLTIEDLENGKR